MNFFYFLLLLYSFLYLTACTNNSAEKQKNNKTINALILTQINSLSSKPKLPTCETTSPSFSTLKSAGFEANCGNCHNGSYFQATNYSQVRDLTIPGNANASKLFQKQSTGGSMQIHTTTAIDKAIYCWIQGGSLQ